MSKRDNLLLLEDIVESCCKIQRYVENLSFEDFTKDDKTIDAVIRNFEIIGEAANNLSNDLLNKYTDIQWRQIIGLRNRLIHAYFGIDYTIIWKVISENLNIFKFQIENLIKEINNH